MSLNHADFFHVADEVVTEPYIQNIILSDTFYFDRLKEWFEQYEQFDLPLIENDLRTLFWTTRSFGQNSVLKGS